MLLFIGLIFVSLFILGLLWRKRRWRKQRQTRQLQLRSWVAHHPTIDTGLQQWVLNLSPHECEVLFDLLDGYCDSLNWELNWLFTPQIRKAPLLQTALEKNVSAYASAILLALQMEADVNAYQVYLDFEKKPTARKQRYLVHELYQKIQDSEIAPSPRRFLGRFVRKEANFAQQIATIQHAFEHNPGQAMEFLVEILSGGVANATRLAQQELGPPVLTEMAKSEA